MKIRREKWSTLEDVLDGVWQMLEQGAARSDDPFHWPVLGTAAEAGCSLRTVILRQIDAQDRTMVCHTDARAPKVAEIRKQPQASWLFYHPAKRIQVRMAGHATLHNSDSFADRQWADSSVTSRLNYCASRPPGTPLEKPSAGLPDFLLKKVPALSQTEMGRKHFMAVAVKIHSLDWLMLKITGNRRARFEWDADKLRATWLVP